MKLGFNKKQALHIGKVALYIGVSAVISYLISLTVDNTSLVGPLTPLVNFVLVGIQQFVKAPDEE